MLRYTLELFKSDVSLQNHHFLNVLPVLLSRMKGNRIRWMVPIPMACSVQGLPQLLRCPFMQCPTSHRTLTETAYLFPNCLSFSSYLAFSHLGFQYVRTSQAVDTIEGFSCASTKSKGHTKHNNPCALSLPKILTAPQSE